MSEFNYTLRADEARLNITWAGQNGDLGSPVPFDATESLIKTWAREAVAGGSVSGIRPDLRVDFTHFVVDRFPAGNGAGYHRIFLRPKTPFGAP